MEETKESPHRAPYNNERFFECPSCLHTVPESFIKQYMFDPGTTRKVQNIWPPEEFNKEIAKDHADIKSGKIEIEEVDAAAFARFYVDTFEDSSDEEEGSLHTVIGEHERYAVLGKDPTYNPNRKGSRDYSAKPELQSCAAMVLMTILYAARVARFDLFSP